MSTIEDCVKQETTSSHSSPTQSMTYSQSMDFNQEKQTELPLDQRSKSSEQFMLPPKRAKTSQNRRFTKSDLLFCNISRFGRDGPKITIGTTHYRIKLPDDFPGPGQYYINDADSSTIRYSIARSDPRTYYRSETANADLPNIRTFPERKPINIGRRTGRSFYELPETPAPSFLPPSTLASNSHKISSRRPQSPSNIPGPGEYNPNMNNLGRQPAYSIPTYCIRDSWLTDKEKMPGPGTYNVSRNYVEPHRHSYSFGQKSTKNAAARRSFAFGTYVFSVPEEIDLDEANQYIHDHPEFKNFVKDIMKWVISQKMAKPLNEIRSKFLAERREYEASRQKDMPFKLREFKALVATL
ncbi:hypothetical protein TVAG_193650 [Trichomonas vaginalis G3]|uniref:Uncharacterized protein n=1 Tax=Trichomonas vaginalis (strain ATCC PRA-98 / G3) TaxID=412133 RepID=A2EVL6_TRIV3|nr:sperm-tail PG-rich repeat-containing protein [Trichomonas vaginalis G3]EAY03295.1 hypothetical protein TVAG_193650 [Trichomonas vaginalis G3]KAI5531749.1 sperm-tail PG-rich repeat-containing protein [Trichomonas vaginalis G3]|eukprot:XP_001315518.1 hypothetical protein [Trichomonas vaginalis G3]